MKKNKKPICITIVFLFCIHMCLIAQIQPIIVNCERNTNKGYNFSYTKNVEGSYTVLVKLNNAINLSETEFKVVVNGSAGFLFSVNLLERDKGFGFSSYSISSNRGVLNPSIDTSFVYAMPFRKGTPLLLSNLTDFGERFLGQTPTRKMKAFEFSSFDRDTVCAIRKGVVTSVIDTYEMDTTVSKSYTNHTNSILIEHTDGTFASYSGFKKGCVFVKEGQTVMPCTALGILAHYDALKKYQLRLGVFYLADTNNDSQSNTNKNKRIYEYINPYFLTDKGVCHFQGGRKYSAGVSDFVIEREMTRKELKAIGKKSKTKDNLIKLYDLKKQAVKDTLYFDLNSNIVASRDKATHYSLRWTDPANENRKIINIFYMSGKLKEELFQIDNPQLDLKKPPYWYYKDKDTGHTWFLHGMRRDWYETGELRRVVEFKNGNLNGKIVTYWDNGQLKRTNQDSLGNLISTKCFDKTGKSVAVYPFALTGKFDGGKTTVNDYLKEHIVYPKEAIEKSIEGSVECMINIQPGGMIGNIETIKSAHPLLDAEIKRVLKSMPKWGIGTFDGDAASYSYLSSYMFTLPIAPIDWIQKVIKQDTIYYSKNGTILCTKYGADNYEILSRDPGDSTKVIERVYSINGKLRLEKYFLKSDLINVNKDSIKDVYSPRTLFPKVVNNITRKIEGRYKEWYDNGQLSKDFYVENGKKNGNLNLYWEDGKPRRADVYKNGVLISGECFDKKGKIISYFEADKPASYPGGTEALIAFISKNLRYPPRAIQNNIEGIVFVKFEINEYGRVVSSKVVKSVDKELDREACRLIYSIPKWLPEYCNGDPVSSVRKLGVNFFLK